MKDAVSKRILFCLLFAAASLQAYFEALPQDFTSVALGGGHMFENPALRPPAKADFVYGKPYMGADGAFSSYVLDLSYPFRGAGFDFSQKNFGYSGVYDETQSRLALSYAGYGLAVKKYGVKFHKDSYTASDPYLASASASAMDYDIGIVRRRGGALFSLMISNVLASKVGLGAKESLNRSFSAGAVLPAFIFGVKNNFSMELVINSQDNYESFDYHAGLETYLKQTAVLRFGFDRYYFTPSLEMDFPLDKSGYDVAAGFAYRYPYGTFGEFTDFTTLISIRKRISSSAPEASAGKKALPAAVPAKKSGELKALSEKAGELYNKGEFAGAVKMWREVLASGPEDEGIKKKIEEAEAKILQLRKGDYFNSAVELYKRGEYKEAVEQWKKVLEIEPGHKESIRMIERAKEKIANEKK